MKKSSRYIRETHKVLKTIASTEILPAWAGRDRERTK